MRDKFFSCDWGTSSFRLRLVEVDSLKVFAEVKSDEGIARVHENFQQNSSGEHDRLEHYNAVLSSYVAQIEKQLDASLNSTAIVISGMASSSIGMKELPYKKLPFSIDHTDLYIEVITSEKNGNRDILLVSGAKTGTDVMRGEETQLLGCSINKDENKQVFLFPGTHSKHIVVEKGRATDFKTYMTGEFFQLLSTNSILSKSIVPGGNFDNPENETAFINGVRESRDQNILHAGFLVRTNDLFSRFSKEQNYWYLSGLLIGSELNDLLKQSSQTFTLVSEGMLLRLYAKALKTLATEVSFQTVDINDAILMAHQKIYKNYYSL